MLHAQAFYYTYLREHTDIGLLEYLITIFCFPFAPFPHIAQSKIVEISLVTARYHPEPYETRGIQLIAGAHVNEEGVANRIEK